MQYLEQSTSPTIQMGPFVDETDGKTAETGLTISQADVKLSKNGAAFAQKNESSSATHDTGGWYRVDLNTTDTGTLGRLIVAIHESGALPVWREFMVVPSHVYDGLIGGTDYVKVDVVQVSGDTTAADNLESYCDGTTPIPANTTQVEGADAANQIRNSVINDGDGTKLEAADLNGLASRDPGSQLAAQSDVAGLNDPTAAAIADAVLEESVTDHEAVGYSLASYISAIIVDTGTDGVKLADNAITQAKIAADAIGASELKADAVQEIADQVWDEAQADHVGAGTFGEIATEIAAILLDTGTDGVKLATGAVDADAIADGGADDIATRLLILDLSTVSGEASRSVLNALRAARNKVSITGGVMTVTKEDDTTTAWTASVTSDASAGNITAVDPT